ncbi:MAG: hypothetical protein WHS82_02570 [Candidatus Methanosuratincola sp.]
MEKSKAAGLLIVIMLALGGITVFPQASAQQSASGTTLEIVDEGNYRKIVTEGLTIIFPGEEVKPFFVWWANDDPSKAYVVHFKGLLEYAGVEGSRFNLTNVAEGTLWQRLIASANALELEKSSALAKGLAVAFQANGKLLIASTKAALFRADLSQVKEILNQAIADLEALKDRVNDGEVTGQIDAAIGAIESAVNAIDSGAGKGTVQSRISGAINEMQKLSQKILSKVNLEINEMLERREMLRNMAEGFHPGLLAFAGCKWQLSVPEKISLEDGTPIGLAFNMTLTDAPQKFEFAEGNVRLAIRIYNATVLETVIAGGESFTYQVAAGEMKIDLIVKDWEWNFDPRTVSLLNTSISISPALALWIDASAFEVNGSVEALFDDLEGVRTPAISSKMKFGVDSENETINLQAQNQEAKELGFKLGLAQKILAGKLMRFPTPAKLRLAEEGTLGGFFKFVPNAVVTDPEGNESVVEVTAAYLAAGNHLKVYLCYPYFNGTLTHDPSLGVERASGGAEYVVTLGAESAIAAIQEIPATPAWGRAYEIFLASGLAAVAAIGIVLVMRRHPLAV